METEICFLDTMLSSGKKFHFQKGTYLGVVESNLNQQKTLRIYCRRVKWSLQGYLYLLY